MVAFLTAGSTIPRARRRTVAKLVTAAAAVTLPVMFLAVPAQAAAPGGTVAPQNAACGHAPPRNLDPISGITGAVNAALIHSGSSTSCTRRGQSAPTDRLDYFCFTSGNDGFTWTYLKNRTTGIAGWTRDDLLPGDGSNFFCGF
jgi:hypothetical protein